MKQVINFAQEVRREFLRIEWPSMREFLGSTVVVLFITAVFTVFLGVLDNSLSNAMYYLYEQSI